MRILALHLVERKALHGHISRRTAFVVAAIARDRPFCRAEISQISSRYTRPRRRSRFVPVPKRGNDEGITVLGEDEAMLAKDGSCVLDPLYIPWDIWSMIPKHYGVMYMYSHAAAWQDDSLAAECGLPQAFRALASLTPKLTSRAHDQAAELTLWALVTTPTSLTLTPLLA